MDIYTAMCKIDCQWEAAVDHRELSLGLYDDPEGWDEGWEGGSRRKRYMSTYS